METLVAKDLTLGYGDDVIIDDLDITIPKGEITVFIGGNGCGKSTLLRSLARLLKPKTGSIVLNGDAIASIPTKDVAKQLAILPQGPTSPEGLTVEDLVKQGRHPHKQMFKRWSKEDEEAVEEALQSTNMDHLRDRDVDSLSGGQRQRAWIAMTLAQGTDTILLDEPTTYLDMTHQIEILDLLFELNEKRNSTIVMVLHDLNMACRYAHQVVAIKDKQIFAHGKPEEIVNCNLIHEVFQMKADVVYDPMFGTPMCIPHGRGRCLIKETIAESQKQTSLTS
ncbi:MULTISPECIES: ABC transporter ATP-binding protein [Gracilibacillus]|uniref:ABC transporter ATP-binding protein n=1 Tax=Gracilibacillus TaxID=74385 RepID=UPI0008260E01|nr:MULTISPECIES: ABC transporter ATP-binding protein [Gracilibacillus]